MPIRALAYALTLALLGLAACGRTRPPSLVLVTIAGFPAAATGSPPATPRIEAFATGARSCPVEVVSTDLLPGVVGLLTGLPPTEHGVTGRGTGESLPSAVATIATRAREMGLKTAAVASAPELAVKAGLDRGFDSFSAPASPDDEPRDPGEAIATARKFLQSLGPKDRFFLWVDLDARDEQGGIAGLAAADAAIGSLLDELLGRGRDETTAVLLAGTLGEPIGAALLDPASARVRFILRPPAAAAATRPCPRTNLAVASEAGQILGLPAFPPLPEEARAESWEAARRFGLDPLRSRPAGAAPAIACAGVAATSLPPPLTVLDLTRAGGGPAETFRGAVLDQERAAIRARHGGQAESLALYTRALAADPLALEALIATARAQATGGEPAAAAQRLRLALPAYRGRADVYHALAHTSFLLGQHDEALAAARITACFLPEDADVAFDVAVNLAALGKSDDALAALARAADLGFHDAKLVTALPAFRPLQSDPRLQSLLARLDRP